MNERTNQLEERLQLTALLDAYCKAFRTGQLDIYQHALNQQGLQQPVLVARILHDNPVGGFEALTNDPNRKIVMFLGPADTQQLIPITDNTQRLASIAYTQDYIDYLVNKGEVFKALITPIDNRVVLADWRGLLQIIEQIYPSEPQLHAMLRIAINIIASINHQYLGEQCQLANSQTINDLTRYYHQLTGFDWHQVFCNGPSDDRYLTLEKLNALFNSSGMSIADFAKNNWYLIRWWLRCELHLQLLYTGIGKTMDEDGRLRAEEYFSANQAISQLPNSRLLDMPL